MDRDGHRSGEPRDGFEDALDIDGDTETDDLTPDLDLLARITDTVDRGAYEHPCSADDLNGDADGDGDVDFDDLLAVIGGWGTCNDCPPSCPGDLNADCEVDFEDLLLVLGGWCGYVLSREELLACFEIDEEDWDEAMEDLDTGSSSVQDDIICWIEHYDSCHCPETCVTPPTGCGSDPFGNH